MDLPRLECTEMAPDDCHHTRTSARTQRTRATSLLLLNDFKTHCVLSDRIVIFFGINMPSCLDWLPTYPTDLDRIDLVPALQLHADSVARTQRHAMQKNDILSGDEF